MLLLHCKPSQDALLFEAQTMRQLHHPHLLRLHCCFLEGDTLWLVMPYVDAGNLATIMHTCAPEVHHQYQMLIFQL